MEEARSVRRVFEQALAETRRDWALGTALSILLAPLALGVTAVLVAVLAAGVGQDLRWHRPPGGLAGAVEVLLALLLTCFVLREGGRTPWRWVLSAAAVLAGVAGLAHATPLPASAPAAFWVVWGVGVLGVLGLAGVGYEAKDDYEVGLGRWKVDHPLTLTHELDRGHLGLGLLVTLPRALLETAGDIATGGWAVRGLDDVEVEGASRVLLGLARGDAALVDGALRRLGPAPGRRVQRVLERMKLVRPGSPPGLTQKGVKLVSQAMAQAMATLRGGPLVAENVEGDPRHHDPRDRPPRARAQP